jgi:hypothetical protein
MDRQNQEVLTMGFTAGTRAIDNYDRCCALFGLKRVLRGNFAPQRMLYAKNATPEGYSVWMLAHSSLNENFNRNRRWYNIFVYPDIIREIWFNSSDIAMSQEDYSYRVCFAKTRDGAYVFQGIYEPQKIEWEKVPDGKTELVRTFKRISRQYPIDGTTDIAPPPPITPPEVKEFVKTSYVVDQCQIKAKILETNKDTTVIVDLALRPFQEYLIGKKVGDRFTLPNVKLTYEIQEILIQNQ